MLCCCFAPSLWLTEKTSRGVNIWICRVFRGYTEYHSVCPFVWIGSSHSLPTSECVSHPTPGSWGGGHTLLWWSECGEWGAHSDDHPGDSGTLYTLCSWESANFQQKTVSVISKQRILEGKYFYSSLFFIGPMHSQKILSLKNIFWRYFTKRGVFCSETIN